MLDPLVYAIIISYNGKKWLTSCIESLRKSTVPLKILLVDNCSTDGSVEFIEKNFPEVVFIKNKENVGFGRANNIGINAALNKKAEYFFLLNQDARIVSNTVDELIKCFVKNKNVGITSPVHLTGTGKTLDLKFKAYLKQYWIRGNLENILSGNYKGTEVEVSFVNAAAWMLNRACVTKVGGFNPLFPHYGEDNDFTNRLYFHNLKLIVKGDALICHDREQRNTNLSFDQLKKREYVSFLKHLGNVRNSFFHSCITALDKMVREAIYYFIKLDVKHSFAVIYAFSASLINLSIVIKSRRYSKREGAYL